MDPTSIGILIVVILLVVEVVVMLLLLKVDKMLLLLPLIGVILAVIALVLNMKHEDLIPLDDPAPFIVICVMIAASIILGLFGVAVWFKGESEARRLVSTEKSIDSAVSGIESDVSGGGMELEHFDDEMGEIKSKVDDYESREKEV
ncbi:MAG: hypothetical protein WBB08_06340 [Halobacteriota archaeon]